MKTKLTHLAIISLTFAATLQLQAQGYLVPNGVSYVGLNFFGGYEIDVLQNPTNTDMTGFFLKPQGKTPQTTLYTNTFVFDAYADESVRVFLVSSNNPISLQPILSQSWTELLYSHSYVFTNRVPFYVGLYTGYAPVNGIYSDPLFGWAKLVNNQGVIQMLDSALEYGGGGIYAGTQNIIPVPEPSTLVLGTLGALLFGFVAGKARLAGTLAPPFIRR